MYSFCDAARGVTLVNSLLIKFKKKYTCRRYAGALFVLVVLCVCVCVVNNEPVPYFLLARVTSV